MAQLDDVEKKLSKVVEYLDLLAEVSIKMGCNYSRHGHCHHDAVEFAALMKRLEELR